MTSSADDCCDSGIPHHCNLSLAYPTSPRSSQPRLAQAQERYATATWPEALRSLPQRDGGGSSSPRETEYVPCSRTVPAQRQPAPSWLAVMTIITPRWAERPSMGVVGLRILGLCRFEPPLPPPPPRLRLAKPRPRRVVVPTGGARACRSENFFGTFGCHVKLFQKKNEFGAKCRRRYCPGRQG